MDQEMHEIEPPRDPGMEAEQLRINIENMHDAKPSRHGWVVVLVFFLITLGIFLTWRVNAQTPQVQFQDPEVGRCSLKAGDRNGDGVLTREEADSLTELNLTAYRIHMFEVKTYDDLQNFPHLRKVWLGESSVKELDLSANYELELICVQSDNLEVLTLAVGCYPKLITPTREGELTIRRVYSKNDPNAIWYR
ncbi:MAG: hypothetical protein IJU21_03805 [Bacteroidales bacterium]|nr:hypothetical protein [Bacteroidales bacterium]